MERREPSAVRRRVTVVRPYGDHIRKRMFAHLERAGLVVTAEDVIPVGTSDEDAIAAVRRLGHRVLLVPFHGHRDADGRAVDGLGFLSALGLGGPFPYRVLMPVSRFGAAGLTLAVERHGGPEAPELEPVLFIREDELDRDALAERIRDHVRPVVGAPGSRR